MSLDLVIYVLIAVFIILLLITYLNWIKPANTDQQIFNAFKLKLEEKARLRKKKLEKKATPKFIYYSEKDMNELYRTFKGAVSFREVEESGSNLIYGTADVPVLKLEGKHQLETKTKGIIKELTPSEKLNFVKDALLKNKKLPLKVNLYPIEELQIRKQLRLRFPDKEETSTTFQSHLKDIESLCLKEMKKIFLATDDLIYLSGEFSVNNYNGETIFVLSHAVNESDYINEVFGNKVYFQSTVDSKALDTAFKLKEFARLKLLGKVVITHDNAIERNTKTIIPYAIYI